MTSSRSSREDYRSTPNDDEVAWDNDDAFLHFDPDREVQDPSERRLQEKNQLDTSPLRPLPDILPDIMSEHNSEKSRQPGLEIKSIQSDEHDNFTKTITTKIIGDQALYLRILRYEVRLSSPISQVASNSCTISAHSFRGVLAVGKWTIPRMSWIEVEVTRVIRHSGEQSSTEGFLST